MPGFDAVFYLHDASDVSQGEEDLLLLVLHGRVPGHDDQGFFDADLEVVTGQFQVLQTLFELGGRPPSSLARQGRFEPVARRPGERVPGRALSVSCPAAGAMPDQFILFPLWLPTVTLVSRANQAPVCALPVSRSGQLRACHSLPAGCDTYGSRCAR